MSTRRRMFAMLTVTGLVAMAISAGAYALAGGYYLAVLLTALIGLVALAAFRAEQQHQRLLRTIRTDVAQTYAQLQATLNLFQLIKVDGMLPPMRGWAASPDVIGVLIDELRGTHPKLVVECGSGVSTLWMALAAQQYSRDTRIVALDHDKDYADKTRDLLERHGVAEFADVRHAPLTDGGGGQSWYAPAATEDLKNIDLLFVDGPPMTTGPLARMPALPVLWERLAPRSVVVLDDMNREDEQTIAAAWLVDHPELVRQDITTEKGTTILRR